MSRGELPTMLFVRDFKVVRGGHLKVFDYYMHAAASGFVRPLLYMSPGSRRDATNPWYAAGVREEENVTVADAYFVAGLDWQVLDRAGIDTRGTPAINLVQHFRHTDPGDPRHAYLRRPALRICVSDELAQAVRDAGGPGGDVVAIPNGTDLHALAAYRTDTKSCDVFIGGLKNPAEAAAIATIVAGRGSSVDLAVDVVPRERYLARIAAARVAVFLPGQGEGFYLPALEAMALGTPVVVPDCGGNRGFCRDGETCLMPVYSAPELSAAALALCDDAVLRAHLVSAAGREAQTHSLERERDAFTRLLPAALGCG